MATVHRFFEDDVTLLDAVRFRVRRSLPQKSALSNETLYPALSSALKRAVTENGIVASDPDQIPGLQSAHKLGYLHGESVEEGVTSYDFPSELHRTTPAVYVDIRINLGNQVCGITLSPQRV